jgi:hypothetical protein
MVKNKDIVLTVKDIQEFYGCSRMTAMRRKREILSYFGRSFRSRLFRSQLLIYEGFSLGF